MGSSSTSLRITLKISSLIFRLLLNLTFIILIVLFVVNGSKKAFNFTYQLYGPVTVDQEPGRDIPIRINKGESSMDIAGKLELNRVIVDKYSFYFKVKLQNKVIMPGTYIINSSMTYDEILDIITDYSKSVIQDEEIIP
ncbi:MAG: endolytic transglycosylase MltG, partial [Clostridiales bacterium]|nr:endolytic transglycosylase MltG [Clostridiales bacterium]